MANRLTRLVDLVIDRVAFVHAGDDPGAQVVLWKRRPEDRKEETMGRSALEEYRRELAVHRGSGRSSTGGSEVADVKKAQALAAGVHELAEAERRRQAILGRDVSIEKALSIVSGTPEGRRAMAAVHAQGRAGDLAFRKAFAMPEPEAQEQPEPTAAERRLEELSKVRARTSGRPWQSELVEVVKTPEGRAILGDVAAERAAS
jgi:hypothetical protein